MDVKDPQTQQYREIKCDANRATLGPDGPHLYWAGLSIICIWILQFACWVASKIVNTGLSQRRIKQSDVQNGSNSVQDGDKSIESMNDALDTTWKNQCSIFNRMYEYGLGPFDCIRFSRNMLGSIHYAVNGSNEIPEKGISLLDYLCKSHDLSRENYYFKFYISSNDQNDRFKIESGPYEPLGVHVLSSKTTKETNRTKNDDCSDHNEYSDCDDRGIYDKCSDVKIFPIPNDDEQLTLSYKISKPGEFFKQKKTCTINKKDLIWEEHPKISYLEEHNIPTANIKRLFSKITIEEWGDTKVKDAKQDYCFYIEDGRVFLGKDGWNNCPSTCYFTRNIKLADDEQGNVKITGEYCSNECRWKNFSGKIKKDDLKNYTISIPDSEHNEFLQKNKMLPKEGQVTIIEACDEDEDDEEETNKGIKIKIDHDGKFYAQLAGTDAWYDLSYVHLDFEPEKKQLSIKCKYNIRPWCYFKDLDPRRYYENPRLVEGLITVNIEQTRQIEADSYEATGERDFLEHLKEGNFSSLDSNCNFSFDVSDANPKRIKSIQIAEGNTIRIGWGNSPDSFVEAQNVKIKRTDLKSGIITGTYCDKSNNDTSTPFSCNVGLHNMRIQQVLSDAPKVKVDDKEKINSNESSKGMELDEFLKRLDKIVKWDVGQNQTVSRELKAVHNNQRVRFKIIRNKNNATFSYAFGENLKDLSHNPSSKFLKNPQIFAITNDHRHAIIKAQWTDDSNPSQIHEESFYVDLGDLV